MNIELPRDFIYADSQGRYEAYVEDNVLYVKGCINYEDLMYTITYALKGYGACYYCGCVLHHSIRTLDHLYPRAWGGVSIPNNLIPSCFNCNNEKKEMTYEQYLEWIDAPSEVKKRLCYKEAYRKNSELIHRGKLVLPEEWIVDYDIKEILKRVDLEWIKSINGKNYEKLSKYHDENHAYPQPIIVSANGWVFKGLHILYHAKMHGITKVKAIVLENVVKVSSNDKSEY